MAFSLLLAELMIEAKDNGYMRLDRWPFSLLLAELMIEAAAFKRVFNGSSLLSVSY